MRKGRAAFLPKQEKRAAERADIWHATLMLLCEIREKGTC